MKKNIWILPVIVVLTLYSCGRSVEFSSPSLEEKSGDFHEMDEIATEQDKEILLFERKIIKNGSITFETFNAQETRAFIMKGVSEAKGYISSDNIFDYGQRREHNITIRVPSEKFDLLVEELSASAARLDRKEIGATDVTEEFIDVEARIKTKKELETRFKELLKQAKSVQEILEVEKEIGKLRTEIESIEGRFRYIKDRVAFSTLNVVFYEKTSQPFDFARKIGEGIKSGWTSLLWFLLGLVHVWPFVLALAVGGFYFRRHYKNKRK